MPPFLAHLRSFLDLVARGIQLDLPERRQTLMRAIEAFAADEPHRAEAVHSVWSRHLDAWCQELAGRLLGIGVAPDALPKTLDIAIFRALEVKATTGSFALDLELKRLSPPIDAFEGSLGQVEAYARAVELVDETGLTRPGRALLSMNERNARRWLLTLEMLLTTGFDDPLRVWPGLLAGFIQKPSQTFHLDGQPHERPDEVELLQAKRLQSLRFLTVTIDPYGDMLHVTAPDPSLRLFEEVLKTPDTPFGVLASAMVVDRERLTLEQDQPTPSPPETSSVSTAIRHARLVTHELTNALLPIQQALGSLGRGLHSIPGANMLRPDLERAERAVGRIFSFAARQQEIAELGAPGEDVFDPRRVLEAAVITVKNGAGAPVVMELPDELPPVRGLPDHLHMVVVNVLRNGVEAVGQGGQVRLRAETSPQGGLQVRIDDDGPGIPSGVVPFIFQAGFSTRVGGSGMGLALAHETLSTWGGEIRYEAGPGGGACFILTLPRVSRS